MRLIIFLLLTIIFQAQGQLSNVLGQSRISEAQAIAKAQLQTPSSLKAAYYSTQILQSLNINDYKCNCGKISALFSKEFRAIEIYHGIAAAKSCKCNDVKINDKQENEIKNGLKASELPTLAAAALAGKTAQLDNMDDVLDRILDFSSPDGTFKTTLGGGKGSIQNAKLALQALSVYSTTPKLSKALENGLQLLPSGEAEGDSSAVDPTLLVYLKGTAEKKLKSKVRQLASITSSLLSLQYMGAEDDYQTLSMCIEALVTLKGYKATPLHVTVSDIKADNNGVKANVGITNMFGEKVAVTSVDAKAVKRLSPGGESVGKSIFSGALVGSTLDLSSASEFMSPGRYSAELSIEAPDAGFVKPLTVVVRFIVPRMLDITKVSAGVSDVKQVSASELLSISSPNKWNGASASSGAGDFIHIMFTVQQVKVGKGEKRFLKPHQVFVRFAHAATGSDAFFVATADSALSEGLGSRYKTTIAVNKEIETFNHLSGEYVVSLLVADFSTGEPSEFILGAIEVIVPSKVEKISPLYTTSLLHTSDNTLSALPEIEHKMRPPAKRASSLMASIFTLLCIIPLLAFVHVIISLKPNTKRFSSLSSYLFLACIAGSLVLYVAYWVALPGASFYQTIKYLCFIVPITGVIGRSAISAMSDGSAKDKKE